MNLYQNFKHQHYSKIQIHKMDILIFLQTIKFRIWNLKILLFLKMSQKIIIIALKCIIYFKKKVKSNEYLRLKKLLHLS